MTYNYYHTYPTCPNCLEPNNKGLTLKLVVCKGCTTCSEQCELKYLENQSNDSIELFHCSSCDAIFYKNIDFSNFKDTLKHINNHDKFNSKIPLFWNIKPNPIENEYLKWIPDINGKFIITWPWKEVKFIPLLISEYMENNPNSRVVVIDELYDKQDNNINKPSSFDLFENLIYSTKKEELNDTLENDWKKFSYKNLFKKINKYHYSIKLLNKSEPRNDFSKVELDLTLKQFNGVIAREIKDKYGLKSIKTNIINKRPHKRYCSEEGFIELKVDKQYSWTQKAYKFKNKDYWNNIININNFESVKSKFKYVKILEDKTTEDNNTYLKIKMDDTWSHIKLNDFNLDANIYFISNQIENIFDLVQKINPNLIIFSNADEFIKEYRIYRTKLGRDFSKFIKQSYSDCLLFSTSKDIRHLYGFNSEKNSFIKNNNLFVHTWDNENVLSQIEIKDEEDKTAGSSSLKKIEKSKINLENIEYKIINDLNEFESLISEIVKETENINYKKYLSRLSRSPLYLDSNDKELNFNMKTTGVDLDYILEDLYINNSPLFDELRNQYQKLYQNENNPLLSEIINYTEDILKRSRKNIVKIILYNKYEVKSFKKIIEKKGNNWDNVEILTWNELDSTLNKDLNNIHIISTSYPHLSYEMFYSNFDNFIFIGSKDYLNTTKRILENRIDIKNSRPLYPENNVPNLLKDILLNLKNIPLLNKDIDEIKIDEPIDTSNKNLDMNIVPKSFHLNKTETALILINRDEEGVFIPLNHQIMVKDTINIVDDIKLDAKNYNKIINREIILNKDNFIILFRDIFLNFMLENGNNIKINSETYTWETFFELVNNSYEWLRDLNKTVLCIMEKYDLNEDEAKEKLAYELTKSKINAKRIEYIKIRWLNQSKILKTKQGTLNIYNVERPKGYKSDLFKIYSIISQYMPQIDVYEKTSNIYSAIKTLNKLRNGFLKGKKINITHQHLYHQFQNELEYLLRRYDLFKIMDVKKVKITKEVQPFKKVKNFQEFY